MTITARAAAAAVLTLALAMSVGTAHARGSHWTTLAKVDRGKLQACKRPTTPDGPWAIHLRVDARNATTAVHGSSIVYRDDRATHRRRRSGRIEPGGVSKVGAVRLPRGSAYALQAQIATDHSGSAGLLRAGSIHRC